MRDATASGAAAAVVAMIAAAAWAGDAGGGSGAPGVTLTADPSKVLNAIDEKVYGHFLEHIYHSCNGGLWGELIWNRSFERSPAGRWSVRDGCVVQTGMGTNQRLVFGDKSWRDYEFELEAKKTSGREGFLVLFRVAGRKDFYWLNLGGWGNVRHQLERGRSGERRWRPVGPSVQGKIETGRWYRIKVRCEGVRFRVWLDGKELLSFEDAGRHRSGCVGVGTWSTQAMFRGLKVTSLSGKTLHEGLPKGLAQPAVGPRWQTFGGGLAVLEDKDTLNSSHCVRIDAAGKETGLRQVGLWLRKGETYGGSLWVRGAAEGGLAVRLTHGKATAAGGAPAAGGGEVLAEQALAAPTKAWAERTFRLRPSAGTNDGAIEVAVKGEGTVRLDQVSLMPQSWRSAGGFRPDLLEAIAALRPPVIRWPGGCFASAYRWKDGIGPQHKRRAYPREIWDDRDVNSFGTDEFVALCRRVGAEPLIVINIGTANWNAGSKDDFVREALDWMEYCNGPADSRWGKVRAANGHAEPYGVRYWEIDNETWHMGAERYASAVRRFASAMRKADASIKLAACGSGGYGGGSRGLGWNRVIVERCAGLIDYLSIHHYENPRNYADGPRRYEAFFRRTGELIAKSRNPKLKIYVSEWNAQSTDWRTGLYCGGLLNAFERCGDVLAMGGPALFLRHASATAWDNAFINFDNRRWFAAPNYAVMKLWREQYAPHRIALTGEAGPLNVVATKSADGRTVTLKAVNPSRSAVSVTLKLAGGARATGAALTLVAPGSPEARNTLASPRAVAPKAGKAGVRGGAVQFELPALSAGVVRVRTSPAD